MKRTFSLSWNASTQPRKQRKYRFHAPLHLRKKFVHATLTKELRKKYQRRAVALRTQDTVRVMRGQFKSRTGAVEEVDLKTSKVFVIGMEMVKKDGSKSRYPLDASNLQITSLHLDDKQRKKMLERKSTKA